MRDIYSSNELSVVVDNNILVDLYELESLHLLFEIFHTVMIPRILYDNEVQQVVKNELKSFSFKLGAISTEIGYQTYQTLLSNEQFRRLSRYDKFAISIAKENMCYCNSNDLPVRKACEQLDVLCTGILGVLGRAYKMEKITKTNLQNLLDKLISDETSCYIKSELIKEFKEEVFE